MTVILKQAIAENIACRQRARLFLILLVNATCIVCDQATKLIAKRYLQPGAIFSFAGDMFRLQYAENTGAFLSLGSSLPESWRHITFTVLVGIFLAALLLYTIFSRSSPRARLFVYRSYAAAALATLSTVLFMTAAWSIF